MIQDFRGKTAFVTGGSGGLGKAIAKNLASRGAHISIFSRNPGPLEEAKLEIQATRRSKNQEVNVIAMDMSDALKVEKSFRSQPRIADIVYCVAGGNHAENGFLVDIEAGHIDTCMKNNYYASAYAAKSILDIWTEDDEKAAAASHPNLRQIVFISSAAAFLGLPGSIAYTPAKCAVRALADSLRMELLRFNCSNSTYSVHCAFPADFISPGFALEQSTKTPLTKRIQGVDKCISELQAKFPSSDQVSSQIIAAVDRGDFIICEDSLAASLLFNGMIGPSPKRGWGVVDGLLSLVVGWFAWPVLRQRWEAMTRQDGEHMRRHRN